MGFIKRNSIICVFLAVLLLLASCAQGKPGTGDESRTPAQSADTVSKDGAQWIEELLKTDYTYRNKMFRLVTVSESMFSDTSETPLAKAIMLRNNLIEQKLGIGINIVCRDADTIKRELRAASKKNEPYADLICAPSSVLAELAAEGLLENLRQLPYLDFNAGYVDREGAKKQTVNNTLYMLSGDLTLDTNSCIGIFYNKKLLEGSGADPVELVKTGRFTWGIFESMVKYVSDGGARGIESLLTKEELACAVYGSSGSLIAETGAGRPAKSVYNIEAAEETADITEGIFKNPEYTTDGGQSSAIQAFKQGKLGFLVGTMDKVSLLDGSKSEWGLLPFPKHSTEQADYSTPLSGSAPALAVPRGCKDSGFSGFVLNALLAATTDSLEEALKVTYRNYHLWSNDAALMLNLISGKKHYDFGVCYASVPEVAAVGAAPLKSGLRGALGETEKEAFGAFAARLFY